MSGVRCRWYDDQRTIILIEYTDPWTWEDFHVAWGEVIRMMGSVTNTVDLIVDMRRGPDTPDPEVITHYQAVWDLMPTNVGRILGVGASKFRARMGAIFADGIRGGIRLQYFDTVEDAIRDLRRQ